MTELPGGDVPAIVLVDATSEVERRLVEAALTEFGDGPVTVVPLRADALADPLRGADPATVVTALRVAWMPRRPGERPAGRRRRSRVTAAALSLPRRPPRALQTA